MPGREEEKKWREEGEISRGIEIKKGRATGMTREGEKEHVGQRKSYEMQGMERKQEIDKEKTEKGREERRRRRREAGVCVCFFEKAAKFYFCLKVE